MRDPDSALRTVLERRQSIYQDAQLALAERERTIAHEREVLVAREARYIATSDQLAERMQASVGGALDVGVLGDLESFLGYCEVEIIQQLSAVDVAIAEADAARQQLIEAHQGGAQPGGGARRPDEGPPAGDPPQGAAGSRRDCGARAPRGRRRMNPAESATAARTLGNMSAKRVIAKQMLPVTSFATTLAQATASTAKAVTRPAVTPVAIRPNLPNLPTAPQQSSRLAGAAPAIGSGEVPYADPINQAAAKYGLDPALIAAVTHAESGFNPRAGSSAGAKGLMQLMDATARGLGVTDSFDPAQNIDGGAKFLAGLLKQYKGNTSLALAA